MYDDQITGQAIRGHVMEPIKYVDALNKHYGALGNPPYQWTINDTAALHRLSKPMTKCNVSLLTSGGVSSCAVAPFNPDARNDHRLDAIDRHADSQDFQIHDNYYDHDDAELDLNCLFPIDRLREMEEAGEIGRIAPRLWSGFMGRTYNRTKLIEESAPAFVEQLRQDEVDILVTGPA
jgi:D-proline reductase (dithiol) PrdB